MNTPNRSLTQLFDIGNAYDAVCANPNNGGLYGEACGESPRNEGEGEGREAVAEAQSFDPQHAERHRGEAGDPGRVCVATDRLTENVQPAELAIPSLWRRVTGFFQVGDDKRDALQVILESADVLQRRHSFSKVPPQHAAPNQKRIPIPLAAPATREESASHFKPTPLFDMDKFLAGLVCRLAGVQMTALWRVSEGKNLVLFQHASGSTLAIELENCSVENIQKKIRAANARFHMEQEDAQPTTE